MLEVMSMFKKIMCSMLIAWCVMSPSNLFSMKKDRAKLARLNTQTKILQAELELAKLKKKLKDKRAQDSNDETKKAMRKTKGKKAAPAVQPDAHRVFWTIAGTVLAPAGYSALFYT